MNRWFQGNRTRLKRSVSSAPMLQILAEKKAVDEENQRVRRGREEDRHPRLPVPLCCPTDTGPKRTSIPAHTFRLQSLERDRFVAYNRTFGEASAPLKFDRELTAELLIRDRRRRVRRLEGEIRPIEKSAAAAVSLSARRRLSLSRWICS